MRYLSDDDLRKLCPAEYASLGSPVPTQMISNGEFTPLPQTDDQRRVERELEKLTDELAARHEPPPVPREQRRHVGGVRRDEHGFRPRVHGVEGRSRDARRGRGPRPC